MEENDYAIRGKNSQPFTAKCGAVFPRPALIGYPLEYCLERGIKVTY